ncbi:MAG: hypothetical protein JXB88_24575, partial [Spirochaetales bacterium]|nr:hypothetical protein [Spirochaetales bacterium]
LSLFYFRSFISVYSVCSVVFKTCYGVRTPFPLSSFPLISGKKQSTLVLEKERTWGEKVKKNRQ